MTVKERLKEFIQYEKIPVRRFEERVGVSFGYVNAIRVSIQPEKITSIAREFPNLNTGWLLTGEGEMLKSESKKNTEFEKDSILMSREVFEQFKQYTEIILSQQRTIEILSKKIPFTADIA